MMIYIITEQWCNGTSTGTDHVKGFFTLKAAREWLKRHMKDIISNRLSSEADEYAYLGPEYGAVRTDFKEADIESQSRFNLWLAREGDEYADDPTFSEYRRTFDIEGLDITEDGGGVELEDGRILTVLTAEQQSVLCKLVCHEIDDVKDVVDGRTANSPQDIAVAKAWKDNLERILRVLSI